MKPIWQERWGIFPWPIGNWDSWTKLWHTPSKVLPTSGNLDRYHEGRTLNNLGATMTYGTGLKRPNHFERVCPLPGNRRCLQAA